MWQRHSPTFLHGSNICFVICPLWSWSGHEGSWCPYKRGFRELACPFCHVRLQWEDGCLGGSWLSPDLRSASAMILDFWASRTVRNKCLWFISQSLYGIFVIAAQKDWHLLSTLCTPIPPATFLLLMRAWPGLCFLQSRTLPERSKAQSKLNICLQHM